uniref:Uncharacterized protein n=1 Tax=Lepeophtheirus salmonis TaxID=72036 RepID=A0A0K2VBY9_LEPSM
MNVMSIFPEFPDALSESEKLDPIKIIINIRTITTILSFSFLQKKSKAGIWDELKR